MVSQGGRWPFNVTYRVFVSICVAVLTSGPVGGDDVCTVDKDGGTQQQSCTQGCCGSFANRNRDCCSTEGDISTWAIVTIVVCSLFGITIFLIILYCFHKKSTKRELLLRPRSVATSRGGRIDEGRRFRGQLLSISTIEGGEAETRGHVVPPPEYSAAQNYPPGPGSFLPPSYSSLEQVPAASNGITHGHETGGPFRPRVTPTAPPYDGSPPPYQSPDVPPSQHRRNSALHGHSQRLHDAELTNID